MSRRPILLAVLTAMLALVWAATPAQALSVTPPSPHSPNADTLNTSYVVMLIVGVLAMLAINGALIVAVVRFRERRGAEPRRFTAGRGAFRPLLAVLCAVAIAVFVFGVIESDDARSVETSGPQGLGADQTAQVGVRGLPPISVAAETESGSGSPPVIGEPTAPGAPLEINAIAQQWLWRFEYPGHTPSSALFSYGELVVPVDTTVVLNITSTDVLHSWWVPQLGGQVQASPGNVEQTWFKADEVGTYAGASTMYSGTSFPTMRSWVRVVTVPEYRAYIEALSGDLAQAQEIVSKAQRVVDAQ